MKRLVLTVLMMALMATAAAAQAVLSEAGDHYKAAFIALQEKDLDKALVEVNIAIDLVPDNFQPYFLRGDIYLNRKEYSKAEADFTKVISMKSDFPDAYTMRGRALQAQNRLDQALADFDRALSLNPNDKEALFYRPFVYFQQKKFESAQADVKRAQSLGVKFPEEFLKTLGQAGKDRLAPSATRGAPAEAPPPAGPAAKGPTVPIPPALTPPPTPTPAPTPAMPPAVSGLPDLVKLIKQVLPAVVTIAGYNDQGKLTSYGSGFFINAQGHLITNYHVIQSMAHAKVKTHEGKTYPMTTILAADQHADLALCQVDMPGGSPHFLTVSREVPEVGERVVVIGSPQLLEQTVSEGIVSAIRTDTHKGQAIQMTAPISPGSSGGPVLNLKGEVVGVSTFFRKGGQNLNFAIPGHRILALQPGPGRPLAQFYSPPQQGQGKQAYAEGKRLFEAKDYQRALQAFQQAVKAEPNNASAYNYLGLTYKKLGRYDEAAEAYVKAIQLQPQNHVFLFNLGMLMYTVNSYSHAASAFRKAIELQPNDPDCHYMLGRTYAQLGNITASMREYNILQRLEPRLANDLYRYISQ